MILEDITELCEEIKEGKELSKEEALLFLDSEAIDLIFFTANKVFSKNKKEVTFSKNIFLPITNVCRNRCYYCGFRRDINSHEAFLMDMREIDKVLNEAEKRGCKEALISTGEKPEEIPEFRRRLRKLGYERLLDYVYDICRNIHENSNLLCHTNIGVCDYDELKMLKEYNASLGLMLETIAKVPAHKESPGKNPKLRLKTIENAGRLRIPFTTGLLVGIGESNFDIVESLYEIKNLHEKYGHIQEIIIQNFKPKPNTPFENRPEPDRLKMLKIIFLSRLIFPNGNIQFPPNLNPDLFQVALLLGANDLGGISPVTLDYINPEDPWPSYEELKTKVEEVGFKLKERLPVYDDFISEEWLPDNVYKKCIVLRGKLDV